MLVVVILVGLVGPWIYGSVTIQTSATTISSRARGKWINFHPLLIVDTFGQPIVVELTVDILAASRSPKVALTGSLDLILFAYSKVFLVLTFVESKHQILIVVGHVGQFHLWEVRNGISRWLHIVVFDNQLVRVLFVFQIDDRAESFENLAYCVYSVSRAQILHQNGP